MHHLNVPHALSSLSPGIMPFSVAVDREKHKQNAMKTHQTDTLLLKSAAWDPKRLLTSHRNTQDEHSFSLF